MQLSEADRRVWLLIGATVTLFVTGLLISTQVVTYDYTLIMVTLGGAILGMVSGVLGSFAVLRQQSLISDALSHAALPGVALAFLVGGKDLSVLLIGAGLAGWLGVLMIDAITGTTRIKQDAAMAIVLAAFFAFGLTLLGYIQTRGDASQAGLDEFIFGQAAAISRGDVLLISIVGAVVFTLLAAFWKEFKLVTFNREFAAANGFPVRLIDGLLSLLIVVAIVLGLQLAGVILMVGMLIAPGVAARQWTKKLGQMVVLAGVLGAIAGATGAVISALDAGLPTGPFIIVVASVLVLMSLGFAPERGLLWQWWQQRNERQRVAARYILHDIFSHAQQHDNLHEPMHETTLINVRGEMARVGLKQLQERRWIEPASSEQATGNPTQETLWRLTDEGIDAAQSSTQPHTPLTGNNPTTDDNDSASLAVPHHARTMDIQE